MNKGHMHAKSPCVDYINHRNKLESYCVYKFVKNTCEDTICPSRLRPGSPANEDRGEQGRSQSQQSHYQTDHPFHLTRYCIVRGPGLNMVVNIVGPWLLWCSNKTPTDIYYASLLLLLKPWHKLEELKCNLQSWMEAYKEMLAVKPELHWTMSNIQYCYEYKDAVTNGILRVPTTVLYARSIVKYVVRTTFRHAGRRQAFSPRSGYFQIPLRNLAPFDSICFPSLI